MADVEFETLDSREVNYGNNNFIEISAKKAVTEESDIPFLSISKGYYKDNEKRYKQNLTIPYNQKIVKDVIGGLETLISEEVM